VRTRFPLLREREHLKTLTVLVLEPNRPDNPSCRTRYNNEINAAAGNKFHAPGSPCTAVLTQFCSDGGRCLR
jgi:hypothetical protein